MQFNMPKNFKRGQYYFNSFRGIDLLIGIAGLSISFIAILIYLLVFNGRSFLALLGLVIFPGVICVTLIIPMPKYHNVLELLKIWINWNSKRKKYTWRGIIKYDDYTPENDEP